MICKTNIASADQVDEETNSAAQKDEETNCSAKEDDSNCLKRNTTCKDGDDECRNSKNNMEYKLPAKMSVESDTSPKNNSTPNQNPPPNSIMLVYRQMLSAPGALWVMAYLMVHKLGERGVINTFSLFLRRNGVTLSDLAFWDGTLASVLSLAGSFYAGYALSGDESDGEEERHETNQGKSGKNLSEESKDYSSTHRPMENPSLDDLSRPIKESGARKPQKDKKLLWQMTKYSLLRTLTILLQCFCVYWFDSIANSSPITANIGDSSPSIEKIYITPYVENIVDSSGAIINNTDTNPPDVDSYPNVDTNPTVDSYPNGNTNPDVNTNPNIEKLVDTNPNIGKLVEDSLVSTEKGRATPAGLYAMSMFSLCLMGWTAGVLTPLTFTLMMKVCFFIVHPHDDDFLHPHDEGICRISS